MLDNTNPRGCSLCRLKPVLGILSTRIATGDGPVLGAVELCMFAPVASEKAPIKAASSEVWLFQMSAEQRRVALFQALPEGLGLF